MMTPTALTFRTLSMDLAAFLKYAVNTHSSTKRIEGNPHDICEFNFSDIAQCEDMAGLYLKSKSDNQPLAISDLHGYLNAHRSVVQTIKVAKANGVWERAL